MWKILHYLQISLRFLLRSLGSPEQGLKSLTQQWQVAWLGPGQQPSSFYGTGPSLYIPLLHLDKAQIPLPTQRGHRTWTTGIPSLVTGIGSVADGA